MIRIISLFPVIILLFLNFTCVKGQDTTNLVTAIELVRMNVLYIGVDNPVKIVASGYKSSELEVYIDNGTITGSNGEYIIQPKEIGEATVTVSCRGKEIQKSNFRVKTFGNLVVVILKKDTAYYYRYKEKSSNFTKRDFLNIDEFKVVVEDSDFDVVFEIVGFSLTAEIGDSYKEAVSQGNKFSEEQKAIIKEAKINSKIYIEDFKVKVPDGKIRQIGTMAFTIYSE